MLRIVGWGLMACAVLRRLLLFIIGLVMGGLRLRVQEKEVHAGYHGIHLLGGLDGFPEQYESLYK